jgi:hypothetical protein
LPYIIKRTHLKQFGVEELEFQGVVLVILDDPTSENS